MALLRIEAATSTAETAGVVVARKETAGKVGSAGQWEKKGGEGPPVILSVGLITRANRFLSG